MVGVTLLPGLVLHDNETDMAHLPLPCLTGFLTPMTHLYTSPAMWIATPNSTEVFVFHYTSRTAQGGGGSFKNRKPIGEVRGRQSGIPERSHCWTDRRLISVSLFL